MAAGLSVTRRGGGQLDTPYLGVVTARPDFSLSHLPSPHHNTLPLLTPQIAGAVPVCLAGVGVFEELRVVIDYKDIVSRGGQAQSGTVSVQPGRCTECWPVLSVYKYV